MATLPSPTRRDDSTRFLNMTDAQPSEPTRISPNYFFGEVGLPLFLVPYGAWRWVVAGDHSWDPIMLTFGPPAVFFSMILRCVALRGRAPWPSWCRGAVLLFAPLLQWAFVFYLFFYKGLGTLLQLRQEFST